MSELPHNRITESELAAMPAKARRNADVCKIYLEHEFLEAYAMHTDQRVAENPEGAIGCADDWHEHGRWQFEFLKQRGLTPKHKLLEIGCGTGRLARHVVPYLNTGRYWGVDISKAAMDHARELSHKELWSEKQPLFSFSYPRSPSDFIWSFSVLIHLPEWEIRNIMRRVSMLMHEGSQFMFSFVPEKQSIRTGLKQFRATLDVYANACRDSGLSFEEIPWPHQQHIALARLA